MPARESPIHRIAVDVGNSRIKFGQFRNFSSSSDECGPRSLPEPAATFDLSVATRTGEFGATQLEDWCQRFRSQQTEWIIGSVHRAAAKRLKAKLDQWSGGSDGNWSIHQLTYSDVPLTIHVDFPERVGIDRLLGA